MKPLKPNLDQYFPCSSLVVSRSNRVNWLNSFKNMSARIIRAPRGAKLNCKGWHQEAALRCLMNNLDPDVAERPDDLVVYGGAGKAARNWACFDAIVRSLEELGNDETLLVQSG